MPGDSEAMLAWFDSTRFSDSAVWRVSAGDEGSGHDDAGRDSGGMVKSHRADC